MAERQVGFFLYHEVVDYSALCWKDNETSADNALDEDKLAVMSTELFLLRWLNGQLGLTTSSAKQLKNFSQDLMDARALFVLCKQLCSRTHLGNRV